MKRREQEVSGELEAEKVKGKEKESKIAGLEEALKSKNYVCNVNRVTLPRFRGEGHQNESGEGMEEGEGRAGTETGR